MVSFWFALGKLRELYGKSAFLIGKSNMHGHFAPTGGKSHNMCVYIYIYTCPNKILWNPIQFHWISPMTFAVSFFRRVATCCHSLSVVSGRRIKWFTQIWNQNLDVWASVVWQKLSFPQISCRWSRTGQAFEDQPTKWEQALKLWCLWTVN